MAGTMPDGKAAARPGTAGKAHKGQAALREVVAAVQRRAQEQEFVVPREIRAELSQAGIAETYWKDVITQAGPALAYRRGRYYYVPAGPPRMRIRVRHDQQQQLQLQRAVRWLIRQQRVAEAVQVERRSHPRINFVCPVQVQTDDHEVHNFVSREISMTGIRLLGNHPLRGRKVHVWIPRPDNAEERCCFLAHMLWSAGVGDDLFESGGVFLELVEAEPNPLKIAPTD